MQPEDHGVDRQSRPELIEDFVAQVLIGFALQEPARLRPGGRAFDQREAVFTRFAPQGHDRR